MHVAGDLHADDVIADYQDAIPRGQARVAYAKGEPLT